MHNIMILTSMLFGGGAERVIANLARHLDQSRFRLTIAHLKERGEIGEQLAAAGYDVIGIPHAQRGFSRYLSFRSVSRAVCDRDIDLLHTHTTYSLTDAALCRIALRGRVRLVHTFHFGNYPHCRRRYLLMERTAARVANHLVAVGVEQEAVLRSIFDARRTPLTAILNGTDRPPAMMDQEWARRLAQDGRIVIGTTATFIEQKGLDYLLDVAQLLDRQCSGAVFVVVGDGPLRDRIQARCRRMGLERTVLFAGWKPDADATMMPLYDVLLQPSLWEAMSVVVLEAMAAAKPVVVTDVGDNHHVVRDGETGFVVPPRDVATMAGRLRRLIDSAALRQQFGAAAKRRYEERYTATTMTRRYEELYEHVLSGAPPVSQCDAAGFAASSPEA